MIDQRLTKRLYSCHHLNCARRFKLCETETANYSDNMAGGKYSFAIAPLLLLSFFGSTRTAPTGNNTNYMATHKKIFITADQMDVVISSTLETKVILQKLETLSAENKELAKKFQALEKRVLTLEGRGINTLYNNFNIFIFVEGPTYARLRGQKIPTAASFLFVYGCNFSWLYVLQ